ncbi:MBOAT family O-acyltransferase [Pseudoruminococcus massiliensis]|uniref:MBOAT family O-acyltransferase n=1 Tax=Pseudoruminococcus massiliensis TaxID=2086583 RepID=UPI000D0FFB5C|nr:MBOAT family O-acyltransferase [Pseudoruminococcus massiliensis]HJI57805.1 MBOAT family protein [Oscillospiraceae bacterium]
MVFSSLIFLFVFLPFVLTLYYITPRRFRNLTLFIVDLVFYAWGEPWLVILMLFSILLNYTSGILIGINREKKGLARFIFILSVILNLGLLGFFKYAGFIGETLNMVMPFLNIPILEIALPIGISFYTFQTMSYTIDVYKNTVKVQKNIITFGTYVSLFPQLIAGPIVRYEDVAEQLMHRKETLQGFTDGVKLFLIGLSKKVLLANEMGNLWDAVRESGTQSGALGSWVGIIAYTFQIYFDFCGYSEMAMGLGKMFGFDFLKNFDYPYISKSITEFWRRWHISLGTWFREYVYIPLGGNRKGLYRQIINIAVVWFLTGLWHGASWNFILWGLYFGVLLMIEKLFMLKVLKKAPAIISHIYSIIIILFGWVLFYFENLNEMGIFLARMFGSDGFMMSGDISVKIISYIPLLIVSAITSTPLISKLYHKIKSKPILYVIDNAGCVLALLLCTAALVSSDYNPFLYYKF